jgi:hypothetical protein
VSNWVTPDLNFTGLGEIGMLLAQSVLHLIEAPGEGNNEMLNLNQSVTLPSAIASLHPSKMLMHKTLLSVVVTAMSLAVANVAIACQGKTVIFEDKFNDDSGGWELDKLISFENSAMNARLPAEHVAWPQLNVAFTVRDADICVEVVNPTATADDDPSSGIVFWAQDYSNYYLFLVRARGTVGIYRYTNKVFATVNSQPMAEVKTAPGASNILRVTIKGNLISMYVNGVKYRDQRAQAPTSDTRFGVYAERHTKADQPLEAKTFTFKNYKVTSAD